MCDMHVCKQSQKKKNARTSGLRTQDVIQGVDKTTETQLYSNTGNYFI